MQILNVVDVGKDYQYQWPDDVENFPSWIDYQVREGGNEYIILIGFGIRPVYDKSRVRVTVWIEGSPEVEFFGVDDFPQSGDVITELKLKGNRICRYPGHPIPIEYGAFTVIGLPTRVSASGVKNTWAIITNIADHRIMIHVAFLKKRQRGRLKT